VDATPPNDSGADTGSDSDTSAQFTGPAQPQFIGRFDTVTSMPNQDMAWSGSAVDVRFRGTKVSVHLHGDANQLNGTPVQNEFSVTLDGQALAKLKIDPTNDTYVLKDSVAAGMDHEITIFKETEAQIGVVTFSGFDFGDGSMVLPSRVVTRHLEFIGDSITCGYGVLGANNMCTYSSDTQEESKAFGALTATALSAQGSYICYSGKGVYRNNDNTTTNTMRDLYPLTLPDGNLTWDFTAAPHPDAVVINLGTNDFAYGTPIPDMAMFVNAYKSLVTTVRSKHPNAYILLTLGPMLGDFDADVPMRLTTARTDIQAVVDSFKSDPKVAFLEFPAQDPSMSACDFHPNQATHQSMSAQLVTALKTALGW
jgi:lysophospholipase L1-like esterase